MPIEQTITPSVRRRQAGEITGDRTTLGWAQGRRLLTHRRVVSVRTGIMRQPCQDRRRRQTGKRRYVDGGGALEVLPMADYAGQGTVAIAVVGDDAAVRSGSSQNQHDEGKHRDGYPTHGPNLSVLRDRPVFARTQFSAGLCVMRAETSEWEVMTCAEEPSYTFV